MKQNLRPIVIINKVDRPTARTKEVENEIFNLFCDLETSNDLIEYPLFYCSGRDGWIKTSHEGEKIKNISFISFRLMEKTLHDRRSMWMSLQRVRKEHFDEREKLKELEDKFERGFCRVMV